MLLFLFKDRLDIFGQLIFSNKENNNDMSTVLRKMILIKKKFQSWKIVLKPDFAVKFIKGLDFSLLSLTELWKFKSSIQTAKMTYKNKY